MRKHFKNSNDAQSEVVGYSLLLGIIVIGVGIVVVLAAPIIQDSKNEAYLKNVEQGFTVLDSKVSMVALGKSPSQLVQIYTQAGDIVIDDDTFSRLTVTFANETTRYEVYNASMGTIEYQLGENKIAYEGGGVFRKYPGDSDPVIITPPEFHYNGETLTLPIIKINSNQSIGGSGVINMYFESDNTPNLLFPNPETNIEFINPLLVEKEISVVIKSDYYKAWAKYIEERTEASVLTNDAEKQLRVTLNAKPNDQEQELAFPIDVYGFDSDNETDLTSFILILNAIESGFGQFDLTLETNTDPAFSIYMKKAGGEGSGGVTVRFIYGTNPNQEEWKTNVTFAYDTDNGTWEYDFVNTSVTAEYTGTWPSWTWDNEISPYNQTYKTGVGYSNLPSVRKIIQHYMQLVGPTFSFNEESTMGLEKGYYINGSSYVFHYEVEPPVITYLHIVEHKVQVTVA